MDLIVIGPMRTMQQMLETVIFTKLNLDDDWHYQRNIVELEEELEIKLDGKSMGYNYDEDNIHKLKDDYV